MYKLREKLVLKYSPLLVPSIKEGEPNNNVIHHIKQHKLVFIENHFCFITSL